METIKRRICLEDFKSRRNTFFGYKDGDWGKIAKDITIEDDSPIMDLKDKLPIVENLFSFDENGMRKQNQLQIRVLTYWYKWIRRFIDETVFYQKCNRKEGGSLKSKWVEIEYDFNNDGIVFYNSAIYLADENFQYGTIIGINENAEIFNNIFRNHDNDIRYELLLLELAENVFNGKYSSTATAYISIPLSINVSFDSLGYYENYIDKWDGKKTYPLGATTLYYDKDRKVWECYKLIKGNDIELVELTGELLNFYYQQLERGIYKEEYKKELDKKSKKDNYIKNGLLKQGKPIIVTENKKWYLPSIVYKGNYNIVKGEYDFNTDTNIFWEKTEINEETADVVKASVESKLNSLIRDKKTVDEDGNVLPFIINRDGDIETELRYGMGYTNYNITNNGEVYFDSLESIEIYDSEGELFKTIKFINNRVLHIEPNGDENESNSIYVSSAIFPENGSIKFIYRIGGIMSELSNNEINIIEDSGIRYYETYNFEKINSFFNIKLNRYVSDPILDIIDYTPKEGEDVSEYPKWGENMRKKSNIGKVYKVEDENGEVTLKQLQSKYTYISIDYDGEKQEIVNEYLNSKTENVIMSNMEYKGIAQTDDNFMQSEIFKNQLTIGLEEKEEDIDINIERGTSAAFELHHILSEVNTFQDLENYRNNLFKL